MAASHITAVRLATQMEWDRAWVESTTATFYESRQWADVWSEYTNGRMRPQPRLVVFDDGTNVVVPMSADVRAGGLLALNRMSPGDTYGGWLQAGTIGLAQTGELIRLIARHTGSIRWLVDPFLALSVGSAAFPRADRHTLALDLTEGFDACRRRWSKGHRSAVAQARRLGVTVRVAQSLDDWAAYFRVYQDSLRRWGAQTTSRYEWSLFVGLAHLETDLVRLWIATLDDEVIAGVLCLYHPFQVVHWHGASKEQYFPFRPANLLIHEAVRHACEAGAKWFDLGPSGGHEGVERFKLGYGPSVLEFPVVDRSSPIVGLARSIRSARRLGGL